jgi:hypothetical protein
VAGDVVEAGRDRVRIVRAHHAVEPAGRFRFVGPHVDAFLDAGDALPTHNGHVVGLGANEVGLVEANRAARFAWQLADRFRVLGAFGNHDVRLERGGDRAADVIRLVER